MPLLHPGEYSPEALLADLPLQRAYQNHLEMQLIALSEGLDLPISPVLRPDEQSGVQQYTCGDFETLPQIATRFFGQPDKWPAIAKANRLEYPYIVVPGQILDIPAL